MAESSKRPKNLPPERKDATFQVRAPNSTSPVSSVSPHLPLDGASDWENLVGALRLHRRQLLRIDGVTAVDIGYKLDEDTRTYSSQLALRVHVARKRPLEYFKDHPHELICKSSKRSEDPELDKLPERTYKGPHGPVVLDVIEAKYRPAASPLLPQRAPVFEAPRSRRDIDRRRRLDPLVGGISIGSPHTPVGTLGALVWDRTDGTVCILSNWHVLAGDLHAEAGTPCFQPGRFDQGRSSDVVAHLKRWSFDRHTDAAIAELNGSRHYCAGEILELFQPISRTTDPHLGMVVFKSSRSTQVTEAFIDGLYFSTTIDYGNGIVREFENQIHIAPIPPDDETEPIQPISDPGDSGSVWVTRNSAGYLAVGLHFAGDLPRSAFGEYALANPIRIVKQSLNFSFRPRFLEIRDDMVLRPGIPGIEIGNVNGNGNRNRIGGHPIAQLSHGLTGPGGQDGDPIEINPGGG